VVVVRGKEGMQSNMSEHLYELHASPEFVEMNRFLYPEILDVARWNVTMIGRV